MLSAFTSSTVGRGNIKGSIVPLTAGVRNRIHGRTVGGDKGGVGENQGGASSANFAPGDESVTRSCGSMCGKSRSGGFTSRLVQITIRALRCDLRLRRSLCGKASPFRCATFHQTCFPPRESVSLSVDGSVGRRIHAAENHNISENSAGKAEPFHKAGGEALSTFR